MREYYDRVLSCSHLAPARRVDQDEYWRLRSNLCESIARNWETIKVASPDVARADAELESFLMRNSKTTFIIFRREDLVVQTEAGCPRFLR